MNLIPRGIALLLLSATSPASSLMNMSDRDLSEGHYARAVEEGNRAAALFRAAEDLANEGNALTITGVAHIYAGEYPAALKDSLRALEIARRTGDRANEVTRLNNIGNICYFEGRYADALEEYDSAARVVEAHPNEPWAASRRQLTVANLASLYQRLGQYDRALNAYSGLRTSHGALTVSEQAQLLANMGSLYRRLGDAPKALETYRAAQQLYRRDELRSGEIAVLNNIGIAEAIDLGQLPEALAAFGKALSMAESSSDKREALHALLYRAEALFRMNRNSDSARDFTRAAALSDSLSADEEKWKALYGLARIAEREGDSKRTVDLLHRAVSLIESLRGSGPERLRGGFLADKRQVYDLLIENLAKQAAPDAREIFRNMELSRERTLQERGGDNKGLDRAQALLPRDALLLEYWVGEDALALVWATNGNAGVNYRFAGPGLRSRVSAFTAMLRDPADSRWNAASTAFASLLLGRVSKALADRELRNLIVIPDREMAQIPFEVLTGQLAGLAVSYLPAASLLRSAGTRRSLVPFWRRTVLAFADPEPGTAKPALELSPERTVRRLPAAAEEARDAAALIGGRTSLFIGRRASKENLAAGLALHYPVLHLATHAFSDLEDSARSWILFAPSKPSQTWDYLFLNEAANLNLHGVDLVTVSACDTETGKLVEGEGVSGFSRAFLKAGARAVVTSLWKVGDAPTQELMELFYRNLARGDRAAEALAAAKSEYARHRPHPYYWAAFVLNGDASVRVPFVVSGTWTAAGAFALVGFFALLWSFRTKARKASASGPYRRRSAP